MTKDLFLQVKPPYCTKRGIKPPYCTKRGRVRSIVCVCVKAPNKRSKQKRNDSKYTNETNSFITTRYVIQQFLQMRLLDNHFFAKQRKLNNFKIHTSLIYTSVHDTVPFNCTLEDGQRMGQLKCCGKNKRINL